MKTLLAINKSWIFWLDRAAIYTLPVGTLFSLFMIFTQTLPFSICAIGVIATALTLSIAHHLCLYSLVKCPKCGCNLARFKNDDKIPPKQLYMALKAGKPCFNCGWEAFAEFKPREEPKDSNEKSGQS